MNLQKFSPWNWLRNEEPASSSLTRLSGSEPLARINREFDRLFEDFLGSRMPEFDRDIMLRPSVDIAESPRAYRISVEVPGVDEDDIELTVEGDSLLIAGEKKRETEADEDGFHRVERRYGSFRRMLALPTDADPSEISAKFKNGVLTISVPRSGKENGSAKRIPIAH